MPKAIKWTKNNIPDLTGKTAIITGANSGIGYETALELAKHNCKIIMACRDVSKGETARQQILNASPNTNKDNLVVELLDLSNFNSVHFFCDKIKKHYASLSLLVNNAGALNLPYKKTQDGNETTFQTNYLGHVLLTNLLYPLLNKDGHARIVEVTSNSHVLGNINFDNLNSEQFYNKTDAYPNSKLAGLIFSFELNRRIIAANHSVISVAAHPGYAETHILSNNPGCMQNFIFKLGNSILAQSAERGAIPILYACVAENVKGGETYGPDGWLSLGKVKEMKGDYPAHAHVSEQAQDKDTAKKLWKVTEDMLGKYFTPVPELESGCDQALMTLS